MSKSALTEEGVINSDNNISSSSSSGSAPIGATVRSSSATSITDANLCQAQLVLPQVIA